MIFPTIRISTALYLFRSLLLLCIGMHQSDGIACSQQYTISAIPHEIVRYIYTACDSHEPRLNLAGTCTLYTTIWKQCREHFPLFYLRIHTKEFGAVAYDIAKVQNKHIASLKLDSKSWIIDEKSNNFFVYAYTPYRGKYNMSPICCTLLYGEYNYNHSPKVTFFNTFQFYFCDQQRHVLSDNGSLPYTIDCTAKEMVVTELDHRIELSQWCYYINAASHEVVRYQVVHNTNENNIPFYTRWVMYMPSGKKTSFTHCEGAIVPGFVRRFVHQHMLKNDAIEKKERKLRTQRERFNFFQGRLALCVIFLGALLTWLYKRGDNFYRILGMKPIPDVT